MADKQQKRKEYMKTYRERNCEEMRAQKRLHYEENRETILEQKHEHYIGNRDVILKQRSENREVNSAQNHEYYLANRDDILHEKRRNYVENRQVINDWVNNRRQSTSERHFKSAVFGSPNFVYPKTHNLGPLNIECQYCEAVHFKDALKSMCCHNGKLSYLSVQNGPENFPIALENLFIGTDAKCKNFREFIRQYNNANAFASMGAKIEDIPENGPYCFKISGDVYHRTSENIQIDTTLQPNSVQKLIHQPSYAELYVYDADTSIVIRMTESANAQCIRDNMITINAVLNDVSPYASCFRKFREIYDKELSNARITGSSMKKISLIFTRNLHDDQRIYNAPRTSDDIAIVYVADRDGNIPAELDFAVQPSGPRFMSKLYQDNMAMVRKFGRPDLFITFTCNPKWEEIKSELKAFQNSSDRPDLVTRVFRLKLKEFLDDIVKRKIFGEILAYVYVIEHQKRGLSHAHCLFTLSNEDKIKRADDVDNIISADIHGPCGRLNPKSICMVEGSGSKDFPKAFCNETDISTDGYPIYRRRNNSNETHFTRNNIQVANRFVVPSNSFLSLKYNAHINVELCSTVKAIKYINKYITKGYDCARIGVQVNANDNVEKVVDYDEIKQYLNCRYISSQEATWHLQDFPIHGPDATSFEDLKKFNGQNYSTYKHVERVRGLINDSNEWHNCMYEASSYMMPKCLRSLLVAIICHCNPPNPLQLFEDFEENMIEDFIQQGNSVEKSLKLCINGIRMQIPQNGFDFNPFLPFSNFEDISDREDNLVNCTVDGNNLLWNDLNSDQLLAANTILKSLVDLNSQKCFYLDGPGGSGKTFLYRALIQKVDLIDKKTLIVTWTGIAATLLPGGVTCHSAFSLLLDLSTDEAPMAPGTALEIVDLIFQDLMGVQMPFGGKVVVLGGDFRQVLPVIRKGSRCAIIASTIKKSSVWPFFQT
ncbi:unnamed protein product, partial [Rotaria sp. Silwood1]